MIALLIKSKFRKAGIEAEELEFGIDFLTDTGEMTVKGKMKGEPYEKKTPFKPSEEEEYQVMASSLVKKQPDCKEITGIYAKMVFSEKTMHSVTGYISKDGEKKVHTETKKI